MRRSTTLTATLVAAAAAIATLATPARSADKSFTLECEDRAGSFRAGATFSGSGAPTARYEIRIWAIDRMDDGHAPRIRLRSSNKDGSFTDYSWRTGDQGQNVLTGWDTHLQQPKGLARVYLEAYTVDGDVNYRCGDHFPK
ncbi:hypothetical protein ACFU5O_16100 [Streptomyces sp. NPDC057445]|uniref:hypothetical protein n=1 Tax=Streptomyces sp. NPDC057445 TaxID=3346136 RepID=UPI0036BD092D